MKLRVAIILSVLALCVVGFAYAQTSDYHLKIGMKPSKSTSPEVIDMKWARQYMDDNATIESNATRKDK